MTLSDPFRDAGPTPPLHYTEVAEGGGALNAHACALTRSSGYTRGFHLILLAIPEDADYKLHFTDGETEAQRRNVTCSGPHKESQDFNPGPSGPAAVLFPHRDRLLASGPSAETKAGISTLLPVALRQPLAINRELAAEGPRAGSRDAKHLKETGKT